MNTPFPAYRGDQPFLFVCYAHADAEHVYPEITWLREQNLNIWYDEGISGGKIWREEIGNAIKRAHKVLFYVSSASLRSDHCSRELNFSLDENKAIIPVYLENVELTTDLQVGLSRVQALHRDRDGRYRTHLLRALEPQRAGVTGLPLAEQQNGRTWKSLAYALLAVVTMAVGGWFWLGFSPDFTRSNFSNSVTLVVRPFSDEMDTAIGLEYELQRRLSTSPGLSVRVTDEDAVKADYVLRGEMLGNVLSLSLEDKAGDLTVLPSIDLEENLATTAASLSRNLLSRLGKSADARTSNSEIEPEAFRQYLSATSLLRSSSAIDTLNQAIERFQSVLDHEPRFAPAHSGLCNAYLKIYSQNHDSEYFANAEQHCHRALTLDETDTNGHIALAMLYRESGQPDKAIDRYREALATSPYSTDAMRGLGLTLLRAGAVSEAENILSDAIELEPNYWENYEAYGFLLFQNGQFGQAAESFQAAHALAPTETGVLNNIGAAFYMAEKFELAVEFWEQAVALGTSVETYSNLGSALFFLRNFEAALDMYEKAKSLSPTDHRHWGHIGDVLTVSGLGDPNPYFQQAIQLATQQLEIDAKDAATIANLGAYYAALGDHDRANQFIKTASKLDSENIDVAYDRAVVQARSGDIEATDKALTKLLELGYSQQLIERDSNFDAVNQDVTHMRGAESD